MAKWIPDTGIPVRTCGYTPLPKYLYNCPDQSTEKGTYLSRVASHIVFRFFSFFFFFSSSRYKP